MEMKFILFVVAAVSAAAVQNKDLLAQKYFKHSLVSETDTDLSTTTTILTCLEPSLLARKAIANITAQNCIVSNSGSYYSSVLSLYNAMNKCFGGSVTNMLDKVLIVGKPIVEPLYNTPRSCPNATVSNNTWGWINSQVNATVVNKYCTNIVKQNVVNKTEWGCLKNPGNQTANFTSYACFKLTPSS